MTSYFHITDLADARSRFRTHDVRSNEIGSFHLQSLASAEAEGISESRPEMMFTKCNIMSTDVRQANIKRCANDICVTLCIVACEIRSWMEFMEDASDCVFPNKSIVSLCSFMWNFAGRHDEKFNVIRNGIRNVDDIAFIMLQPARVLNTDSISDKHARYEEVKVHK